MRSGKSLIALSGIVVLCTLAPLNAFAGQAKMLLAEEITATW